MTAERNWRQIAENLLVAMELQQAAVAITHTPRLPASLTRDENSRLLDLTERSEVYVRQAIEALVEAQPD